MLCWKRLAASVVAILVHVAATAARRDTSWMLKEDACSGFRQNSYDRTFRYAVSKSTTWVKAHPYDCPVGWIRATGRHTDAFTDEGHEHSKGQYVYFFQCGWNAYNFKQGTRHYFRFANSTAYHHAGSEDWVPPKKGSLVSSFAGVLCKEDPSLYPSWMLTKDNCAGFRQNTVLKDVRYAVSRSTVWNPQKKLKCPKGYYWLSSDEWKKLIQGKSSGGHSYRDRCGWSGFHFQGTVRKLFRFSDSHKNYRYKHAGTFDAVNWGVSRQKTQFAGIICKYDPALDVRCDAATTRPLPAVRLVHAPKLKGDLYTVAWILSVKYNSVYFKFSDTPKSSKCNIEFAHSALRQSTDHSSVQKGTPEGQLWSRHDVHGKCTMTVVFACLAEDMVQRCGFREVDRGQGQVRFTNTLVIQTNQTVSSSPAEGKTHHSVRERYFRLTVSVPTRSHVATVVNVVQVEPAGTAGVAGVLKAGVSRPRQPLSAHEHRELQELWFRLLTHTPHPLELRYDDFSFRSSNALGHLTSVAEKDPVCQWETTHNTTRCLQVFSFSKIAITKSCAQGKRALSEDRVSMSFSLGCTADRDPAHPLDARTPLSPGSGEACHPLHGTHVTITLQLSSSAYCAQIENSLVRSTFETFRNVDLTQSSTWNSTRKSQKFRVGTTVFGLVSVYPAHSSIALKSTSIEALSVSFCGVSIGVFSTNGAAALSSGNTAIFNGPFDSAAQRARFSLPLAPGMTLASRSLVGALSAEQAAECASAMLNGTVRLHAVVRYTYTAAPGTSWNESNGSHQGQMGMATIKLRDRQWTNRIAVFQTVDVTELGMRGNFQGSSEQQAALQVWHPVGARTLLVVGFVITVVALCLVACGFRLGQSSGRIAKRTEQGKLLHSLSPTSQLLPSTTSPLTHGRNASGFYAVSHQASSPLRFRS